MDVIPAETDAVLLFLLLEYERHELLFERLRDKGVLSAEDLAAVLLESTKRAAKRTRSQGPEC